MFKQEINPIVAIVSVVIVFAVIFGAYYLATGVFYREPKVPPGGFPAKKATMPPLTRPTNVQHGPIGR